MGPVIGVPVDVAEAIKDKTDLVEVDEVLPDVVDQPDVQVGRAPFGDLLLLIEAPVQGYGPLVGILSDYARNGPRPLELVVMDKDGNPHAFPGQVDVDDGSIHDHLKLAYYGEPGDRRPLIRGDESSVGSG